MQFPDGFMRRHGGVGLRQPRLISWLRCRHASELSQRSIKTAPVGGPAAAAANLALLGVSAFSKRRPTQSVTLGTGAIERFHAYFAHSRQGGLDWGKSAAPQNVTAAGNFRCGVSAHFARPSQFSTEHVSVIADRSAHGPSFLRHHRRRRGVLRSGG